MATIAIVGGGVGGLGSALTFARAGHRVTLFERDATPLPTTADEAFDWDRRGAPQVRHSHAFLARLRGLLAERHPDVLAALLAEGATEARFGDDLPPTVEGYAPEPGDEDLVMIMCRRTTFEWVLRRAVLAEANVDLRDGTTVAGLLSGPDVEPGGPPVVTGVRLADGTEVPADLTVVATGRRSALPDWLAAIGAGPVAEEAEDTGIIYLSRFYRLRPDQELPPRDGPAGGDLGYLKYGIFAGDNRTFSLTLAVATDDHDLRVRLARPEVFEAVAAQLTATARWVEPDRSEPITDVHVMAGLVNRWRELVPDGHPVALGVHAVGDAWLCTNPLYGRGCTTSFWHAQLLADTVAAHPDDLVAQAVSFDQATRTNLLPWYRASVAQDAEARRVASALLAGEDPDGDPDDPRTFMRSVLRDGLLPALRTDAVVLRAFMRSLNMLSSPDALVTDADVGARVLRAWQEREQRAPAPVLGPPRHELLAAIEVLGPAA